MSSKQANTGKTRVKKSKGIGAMNLNGWGGKGLALCSDEKQLVWVAHVYDYN